MQIQSTNDVHTDGIKVLVYGKSGSGKTVLCSTAPNPIIFSAESGLLSLAWANIPYVAINTLDDLYECYKWLSESKDAAKYETICLDSITEIAEIILADEKRKVKDPRKAYGETQDKILELFRAFRNMKGKNIYFSAKEEVSKDGATGVFYNAPMFPGQKLAQHVPYLFDELFQLQVFTDPETKQEIRALRTKLDSQNTAKDRSGKLDEWETPNLTTVFTKILS